MLCDFCRCRLTCGRHCRRRRRCRHFYLYQSQIFIVFVCIVTFGLCFVFDDNTRTKGQTKKGLWLLALPLMLLML